MPRRRIKAEILLASLAVMMLTSAHLFGCPLCNRREACFTSEMDRSDVTVVGKKDLSSSFRIAAVLKGEAFVASESIPGIDIPADQNHIVFGKVKRDANSDTNLIQWFHQYPISNYGMDYLLRAATISGAEDQRLAAFLPYLKSPDLSVADDAFYQIARAKYSDFKQLKNHLDREFVIELFSNPSSVSEVRTLALKMLAICGSRDDAVYPLEIIRSSDVQNLRGVDVAIACYLSLRGEEALQEIEQRFVTEPNVPHNLKLATIRALHFQLRFEDHFDRPTLMSSLRKFAQDPEVFDLVLPDFIQSKDWSVLNEVAEVFKANKQRLIRVTAAEYLLACPNERAKQLLAELRSIDSDAITQAETGTAVFSNVPRSRNDSSFLTAILASRFASPVLMTTLIAAVIVTVVVFLLKRLRR